MDQINALNPVLVKLVSDQLDLPLRKVESTLQLLEEGATIPFISRYRKEATGSLDEVKISDINTAFKRLTELEKRKTQWLLRTNSTTVCSTPTLN